MLNYTMFGFCLKLVALGWPEILINQEINAAALFLLTTIWDICIMVLSFHIHIYPFHIYFQN